MAYRAISLTNDIFIGLKSKYSVRQSKEIDYVTHQPVFCIFRASAGAIKQYLLQVIFMKLIIRSSIC